MAPSRRLFTSLLAAALVVGLWSPALADPAPVADNGEILFVRGRTDGLFLYRVDPDGSNREAVRRIHQDSSEYYTPIDISPEGRRLAMWHVSGDDTELLVGNADGSALTQVATFSWEGFFPMAAWSPDGREFVIVHRGRLYTVPADGSSPPERRPQNLPVGGIMDLQWHPDGQRILLTVLTDQGRQTVWAVDRDGGDHEVFVELPIEGDGLVQDTQVSPDGQQLAYLAEVGGDLSCARDEIRLVDPATGQARTLVEAGELGCGAADLTWAPDGSALVLSVYAYGAGLRVHRVDLADGEVTQLTDPPESSDTLAGWRPVPDLLARACPVGGVPDGGFADTAGTAHERGIDCAAWWEIAAGRTDGTYGPGAPVTRAQMASFVARTLEAAGVELPEVSGSRFDDVDVASTHGRRIEQLAEVGLVDGVAPGVYAPGQAVTRAQMARFLAGAYEHATGLELPRLPDAFVDDDGIALESSVNAVSSVGLASGVEGSRYAPGHPVNRGQMATFLSRLVDRLARDLDLPAR